MSIFPRASFLSRSAWLRLPSRSDWLLMLAFWLVVLPFAVDGYTDTINKFGVGRGISLMITSILAPWLYTLVLVYGLMPILIVGKKPLQFILALLIMSFGMAIGYQLLDNFLCNCYKPIDRGHLQNTLAVLLPVSGILAAVLTGKHFFEIQQRLLKSEQARSESELKRLRAHIDPHFLFNNLNVLGILIQQDQYRASDFLYRFAALYRYLIRHKDDDVVALIDELRFVEDYWFLLEQRFGNSYQLKKELTATNLSSYFVLTGAIQGLLENIIKHNQGSESASTLVRLTIHNEYVQVSNPIRPRMTPVESNGTGLANLKARYQLLTDQPVIITCNKEEFTVRIPLLPFVPTSELVSTDSIFV